MVEDLHDGLSVRKAVLNDIKSIFDFLCDLVGEDFDRDTFNKAFMMNVVNPNNIYLVAEYESEVIGYLSFNSRLLLHHGGKKVGEILEMYVRPEKRSLGVGKLLLDKIKMLSKVIKVHQLEVSSNLERAGSHKFYLREGFVESHKKFVYVIDKQGNEID